MMCILLNEKKFLMHGTKYTHILEHKWNWRNLNKICKYIHLNILDVTLYYNFARCYHGRKPGKEYMKFICINIFFTTACRSTVTLK